MGYVGTRARAAVRAAHGYGRALWAATLTGGGGIGGGFRGGNAAYERELALRLSGRCVLITGASSGIGRAVALQAASHGAKVVLLARSEERLRELKAEIESFGGGAGVYRCDLSSRESTEQLLARLSSDGVVVDVLINNAGRSIRRSIAEAAGRVHDFERTMSLNYFGALRLTLALLPGMRARRRGHIINVSSAGVQIGTPLFSAYAASKAALDTFTRVAASEARGDGVSFTTVHMPLVRTPMITPTEAYRDAPALSAEAAAAIVLRAVVTRERQIGTRIGKLIAVAHHLAPETVERLLTGPGQGALDNQQADGEATRAVTLELLSA